MLNQPGRLYCGFWSTFESHGAKPFQLNSHIGSWQTFWEVKKEIEKLQLPTLIECSLPQRAWLRTLIPWSGPFRRSGDQTALVSWLLNNCVRYLFCGDCSAVTYNFILCFRRYVQNEWVSTKSRLEHLGALSTRHGEPSFPSRYVWDSRLWSGNRRLS